MCMGIVEHDRRGHVFRIFEFLYSLLKTKNIFTQKLSPCLSLPIIVLACIALLGAKTLLAGGLGSIAAHLALPASETCLASLKSSVG